MYTFLERLGVFGAFESSKSAGSPPAWLYDHFCVFIEAMDRYKPSGFLSLQSAVPKTTIIWAKDGVCKDPFHARTESQVLNRTTQKERTGSWTTGPILGLTDGTHP